MSTPADSCGQALETAAAEALKLAGDAEVFEEIWAKTFAFWTTCEAMQTNVERQADFQWEAELAVWLDESGLCPGTPSMVVFG